jgi:hypothetical protein
MKQYVGDFILAGITAFVLMLTGTTIDNRQTPVTPPQIKNTDSIMYDNKIKTMRIKTLLFQSNIGKDTTAKTKKSRVTN